MADPTVEPTAERMGSMKAPTPQHQNLPLSAPPRNHGRTVAAWTTVALVLVGAAVAAVSMIFAIVPLVWTGVAVIVLGGLAGKVLQILGYGQGGSVTLARQGRSRR